MDAKAVKLVEGSFDAKDDGTIEGTAVEVSDEGYSEGVIVGIADGSMLRSV